MSLVPMLVTVVVMSMVMVMVLTMVMLMSFGAVFHGTSYEMLHSTVK
ncbi:hypothetical protein ACFQUU_16815 [Herbaspirillum sp. GCM10030257]